LKHYASKEWITKNEISFHLFSYIPDIDEFSGFPNLVAHWSAVWATN